MASLLTSPVHPAVRQRIIQTISNRREDYKPNPKLEQAKQQWERKHGGFQTWDSTPPFLSNFCAFVGVYGYAMRSFGDIRCGWNRLESLDQITVRQRHRQISGNWKTIWKHAYHS
jgi:hypothetical protein